MATKKQTTDKDTRPTLAERWVQESQLSGGSYIISPAPKSTGKKSATTKKKK